MGVSTLQASNIKGKTFQFARASRPASSVDWALRALCGRGVTPCGCSGLMELCALRFNPTPTPPRFLHCTAYLWTACPSHCTGLTPGHTQPHCLGTEATGGSIKMMQFSGNFKGKPLFWAQALPLVSAPGSSSRDHCFVGCPGRTSRTA